MENPITLKQYLDKGKTFFIPNYQRGYIWGKKRKNKNKQKQKNDKDSVRYVMESIVNSYKNKTELFLQGITVSERGEYIDLIDGQQRTTFFYLLLQYLGYSGAFNLEYSIREKSQDFLNELKNSDLDTVLSLCEEKEDETFQDIYFFKKTIRIINDTIKRMSIDRADLLTHILSGMVKFLYIKIPPEKAVTVFKMMNGNKAEMECEEIIKAEMLRLVSSDEGFSEKQKAEESVRWEQNLLRSRYAREWDKWLYWWNREDIRAFYRTNNVMGLLVKTYFNSKRDRNEEFNFDNFRDICLREEKNDLAAKNTFYELRAMQKQFEDVFNSVNDELRLHNKVGAILTILSPDDSGKFIEECFGKKYNEYFCEKNAIIDEYLKLAYLGVSHSNIIDQLSSSKQVTNAENEDDKNDLELIKDDLVAALEYDNLYETGDKEQAFRQLLRLNVEEDTKLGRKFDFSIWKERSLEHIQPKSKSGAFGEADEIVHSIGNLVLLYKNENSSFGAKDFNEKKKIYFNLTRETSFKSRHLLHSISVFANEKWGVEEVKKNKESIINEVKKHYAI